MTGKSNHPRFTHPKQIGFWQGEKDAIITDPDQMLDCLKDLEQSCLLLEYEGKPAIVPGESFSPGSIGKEGIEVRAFARAVSPEEFGDRSFLTDHGLKAAYMAGAMANGISSVDLVVAMGKAGYLGSYGAGGQHPDRVADAIQDIKKALPNGPYAFNLIHNPVEPLLEQKTTDLYLHHEIRTVEASAYLRLTPMVVQYRAAGLSQDPDGKIVKKNKIIAKLSRAEVARQFMSPAPEKILTSLVESGKISPEQAQYAAQVPMADDITVEADSGGHTDNRPLVGLLPAIIALRDQLHREGILQDDLRIGAGGGIGTPAAALGTFTMGAAYIVTGSINQACREAGTSEAVKRSLAEASSADVMMSPSADMFEMGGKVQVLKRGTMFPLRAQKLYEIYLNNNGLDELNAAEKTELETKIFQKDFNSIWEECIQFFSERDPSVLENAAGNPKRKMALVFRWYLGLATHWGIRGIPERVMDYQIWCGPAMGSFNQWARGTYLQDPEQRLIADVADQIMGGAAYLSRINDLRLQGVAFPPSWTRRIDIE